MKSVTSASWTLALLAALATQAQAAPPAPPAKPAPAATTAPAAQAPQKTIAPAGDINAPARAGVNKPPGATSAATTGAPAPQAGANVPDRLLWDHWYTVTVNKVVHYEYYNDRVEIKKGRLVFQNKAWKQEEDYLNEEQLGVFAKNDLALTPLFFNFHSTYRSIETNIDGTVTDQPGGGRQLSVRIRKGQAELPVVKKMVSPKTFFSAHFPVWLGRHLKSFKVGQVYPFQTILEDNLEADFMTVIGQLRVEPPDAFATKSKTTRLTVNYREMKSVWWIDALGSPYRIEMPLQKTVVQRVTKEVAQKFLDDNG